jgi:energy-coupling factor transporter ATP-binding protein EcfA2
MIKRKLFSELVDHLPQKEMSLIIGPRQAGKTTLMEMLKQHLDKSGERALFLNLDIEWDRPHFESQAALLRKIELELGQQKSYVFIDEIYRSILEKDIAYLLRLDKPDVFSALIKMLTGQVGQLRDALKYRQSFLSFIETQPALLKRIKAANKKKENRSAGSFPTCWPRFSVNANQPNPQTSRPRGLQSEWVPALTWQITRHYMTRWKTRRCQIRA